MAPGRFARLALEVRVLEIAENGGHVGDLRRAPKLQRWRVLGGPRRWDARPDAQERQPRLSLIHI
eukprot:10693470-Lingulodinium_polyedra.AAC.1